MTKAAIGLTVSQQRVLAEIGVDIWVRRVVQPAAKPAEPAAAVAVPASGRAEPASVARNRTPSRRDAALVASTGDGADYQAELDCLATTGVVIVGRWHNPLDKRLANDVVLAIAIAHDPAMMRSAKVQQTAFTWPSTQTGDRSIGAARNAFRAFLRGQAERAHAKCVVLFGDAAGALADDRNSAGPPVLRQPAIGALRADPNSKKALWLNVSQNVPD